MAPKETGIIQRIKTELIAAFSMIDIDPISFYLGLKVEQDRTNQTSKFSQPAYIDKILHRFYPDKTNIVNTSIKEMFLFQAKTDSKTTACEKEIYQSMTSSIMFSMVETRPDIAFVISVISRFTKNPESQYTDIVKAILQYFKDFRNKR